MEIIKIKKTNQSQKIFHEKDINESQIIENPDIVTKKPIPQKLLDIEEMLKETIIRVGSMEERLKNIEDEIKSGLNKISSTFNFYEITEQIQNLTVKFDNIIHYIKQNHNEAVNVSTASKKTNPEPPKNTEKPVDNNVFEAQVLQEEPVNIPSENLEKKILSRLMFQLKDRPYEIDRNFIEILKSFLEKNPQEINAISPFIYNLLGKLDVDQEIILDCIRLLDYLRQKLKEKSQVH